MTDLIRELEAVVRKKRDFEDMTGTAKQMDAAIRDASHTAYMFIYHHHAEVAEAVRDAQTEREIQNAADKLPPGYVIAIYVENGSGYIDLTDPVGGPIRVDTDDKNMAQQIAEAVRAAAIDAVIAELHA